MEKLSVRGILFDGGVNDYQLLANSIHEKKLKSLRLYSAFREVDAFNMICDSLADSEIETLGFSTTSFQGSLQEDINNLSKVIPKMKFLKNLYLDGQRLINKPQLFSALEESNVEYLSLVSTALNDDDALELYKLILSSKLKGLNALLNKMSETGIMALEAAKEEKPGFMVNGRVEFIVHA